MKLKNSSEEFVGLTVDRNGREEETKDEMEKCVLVKRKLCFIEFTSVKYILAIFWKLIN